MDLITGTGVRTDAADLAAGDVAAAGEIPAATQAGEVRADAPIPALHGPAAEPVEPIRARPVRWATRVVPAVGGAAALTWAVLRARRR